tara:strand:+ start:322 stop:504 length:183 start_codon:yes stop_codon:yes gene_type:complete
MSKKVCIIKYMENKSIKINTKFFKFRKYKRIIAQSVDISKPGKKDFIFGDLVETQLDFGP